MALDAAVTNLAIHTTDEAIMMHFAQFHPTKVVVPLHSQTQQRREFGFVTFASEQDCSAAIAALDGTDLNSRTIGVRERVARQAK
ncbi:RNA-binding protein [Streptomyces sp. SID3343]|uniref:RNA recognition motif domain-containing protein n=1 Tax=Streptomyces sp. SID3343 TaxID=2690260 RepID=UPI0013691D20|nr:RNA-binding protein [Streptomyces sp. SID3343]MYW00204.1 hypothetical protein [Streptomyces sp. SID3343]